MKFITVFLSLFLTTGFQQKPATEAMLKNPFDLQQFKKVKRGSNSGIFTPKPYHVKMEGKGRYFYFFLFDVVGDAFVYLPKGNNRMRVRSGMDFQIVTFKPNGKYKDAYLDPTESLIEITTTYNDPHLPELAFIGLDSATIKEKLGPPLTREEGCFIYSQENNVLLLNVSDGTVKCLKYSRLNKPFVAKKIPDGLTDMRCVNRPAR